MTGRGDTQEDTRDVRPEILSHTRPPEENPTTRQGAPNKEKDHIQTETNQNNRQDPRGYAEGDVNKVFQKETSSGGQEAEKTKSTRRPTNKNNQPTRIQTKR